MRSDSETRGLFKRVEEIELWIEFFNSHSFVVLSGLHIPLNLDGIGVFSEKFSRKILPFLFSFLSSIG